MVSPERDPRPESASALPYVPPVPPLTRRDLLRRGGAAAAIAAAATWLPSALSTAHAAPAGPPGRTARRPLRRAPRRTARRDLQPDRPPATPLIVRSPYLSDLAGRRQPARHLVELLDRAHHRAVRPRPHRRRRLRLRRVARAAGRARPHPDDADVACRSPAPARSTPSPAAASPSPSRSSRRSTRANLQRQCVPVRLRDGPGGERRRPRAHRRPALRHLRRVGARRHRHPGHLDAAADRRHDTPLTCTPASPGVLQENGDQATWGIARAGRADRRRVDLADRPGHRRAGRLGRPGRAGRHQRTPPSRARSTTAGRCWPSTRTSGTVAGRRHVARRSPLSVGHVRTPAVSYLGTELQPVVDALLGQLDRTWSDWFDGDYAARARRRDRAGPAAARRRRRPRPAAAAPASTTRRSARWRCARPSAAPNWSTAAARRGRS